MVQYNEGIYINIKFFEELIAFMKKLDDEEKRSLSENLTEEELAVYDLLLKDNLIEEENDMVK